MASLLEDPAEPQPELDIQSQNGVYIFGPFDSIPRLLTLGESRYEPWASRCLPVQGILVALTIWSKVMPPPVRLHGRVGLG